MSWNYRLIRHRDPDGTVVITIHEVYYDESGTPTSVTVDGVEVMGAGESEEVALLDCRGSYRLMAEAFRKPVLDYESFRSPSSDALSSPS